MDKPVQNSEIILDHGRFSTLWDRCVSPGTASDSLRAWQQIVLKYSAPNRHYHDQGHIIHCLSQFDAAASLVDNRDAVEMAIWFHDIILEPGRADNEKRSALLFRKLAAGCLSDDLVTRVSSLVEATTHQQAPHNPDEAVLLDIDLSSLGLPWEQYLKDTNDLLEESAGYPDEASCCPNLKFLRKLMEKERIYHTDFFHACCEARSRENIQRYIDKLKSKGLI